jgi:hypothetical protein
VIATEDRWATERENYPSQMELFGRRRVEMMGQSAR